MLAHAILPKCNNSFINAFVACDFRAIFDPAIT